MQILCEDDEFDDVSECIYIIVLLTSVLAKACALNQKMTPEAINLGALSARIQ